MNTDVNVWLPVLCFFGGLLVSVLFYSILVFILGEEDKLIVFKSKRLTKKERIEKLEEFTKEVDYQIRYIKSRLIDISSKLTEERGKKNK